MIRPSSWPQLIIPPDMCAPLMAQMTTPIVKCWPVISRQGSGAVDGESNSARKARPTNAWNNAVCQVRVIADRQTVFLIEVIIAWDVSPKPSHSEKSRFEFGVAYAE